MHTVGDTVRFKTQLADAFDVHYRPHSPGFDPAKDPTFHVDLAAPAISECVHVRVLDAVADDFDLRKPENVGHAVASSRCPFREH
jgi:hypothetical protein